MLVRDLFGSVQRTEETRNGFSIELARTGEQLVKLAEWISLESRCCPFFRFRIDLRPHSELVQVDLSGPPGSKELIRGYLRYMIPGGA